MAVARQLTIQLKNQPGALAELCTELAKRAVNISAIHGSEARPAGAVRILVSQVEVAKRVCDELGLRYREEPVLTARVGDRPGALGKVTRKLAERGINIDYLYGTIDRGARQALLVLAVSDIEAAARVVK